MIDTTAILLLLASLTLFGLALHPFVTYPASLRVLARLRPRPVATGPVPQSVALCVCAYNEERVIHAKALNMLALRKACPQLDILVYVDAASDRTAEILRGFGTALRVVISPRRMGKTHGMNTLVAMTSAQCLVFSDANVMFAPDAILRLLEPFADPQVGLVCGHLGFTAQGPVSATSATGSAYWRLEEQIKRLESATGSVIGADGSIFALRRSLHQPPPADLIDDMFVSLVVLCRGRRVVRAEAALAFEEQVSRAPEEFRRKVRIACQAFNVHRALAVRMRALGLLDRYKYVSHKLLRWLVAYLLVASLACLLAGLALAGAWLPLTATLIAVLGGAVMLAVTSSHRLLAVRAILMAFLATGIGVWRSLRGERFQTWTPPASSRAAVDPGFAEAES
jgi:cellulose synthase/poly-beta-1,6-N-acetylglucosamine synthase-like glycosyltransferase